MAIQYKRMRLCAPLSLEPNRSLVKQRNDNNLFCILIYVFLTQPCKARKKRKKSHNNKR